MSYKQTKNNQNFQKILDAACNADQSMLVSDLVSCLAELLESQPDQVVAYYYTPSIGNGKRCNMTSLTKQPKFFGLSFEYTTIF